MTRQQKQASTRGKPSFFSLSPLKIALFYVLLGGLWITFSDISLDTFIREADDLTRAQTVKGWSYVVFTALILYLLILRFETTHVKREADQRILLEQASDGIVIADPGGRSLTVNAKACDMLGYSESELRSLDLQDLVPPEDLAAVSLRLDEMRSGKAVLTERNLRRKDGTLLPVEISGRMLQDGRFLAIVRDVSEHRKKDDMLARRSSQLEILCRMSRQMNEMLELPVVMRTLVQAAMDITGSTAGTSGLMESGRMVFREYNDGGRHVAIDYSFEAGYGVPGRVMQTRSPYLSNDAARDVHVVPEIREALGFSNLAAVPLFDRSGALIGCFEVHNTEDRRPFDERDVEMLEGLAAGAAVAIENARLLEEHRRVEASLRESERMFRMLAETAAAAIFIYGASKFLYLNPVAERVTGYSRDELLAMDFWEIIHPDHRGMVKERGAARLRGEAVPSRYEFKIITRSGEERWVDFTAGSIEYAGQSASLGTAYDVTEQKKMEEQLRQSQKMEAVGLLAGGVAHDFNNILTAIIGYGNLAKAKLPADSPVSAYLENILASSDRAANLTHGLLAFSRKQIIDPRAVLVNEIIAGVGTLLSRLIGEDIELHLELAREDMTILADPGQIEQVLMNLATNARDAMPSGGVLTIRSERIRLDEGFFEAHGTGAAGEYALLSVTDTGEGIEDRARQRIFEPFFTTKELGRGTGLGLSIVYGIIMQHDGHVAVSSEPGAGTTFRIYLPLVSTAPESSCSVMPAGFRGGSETILVAEDDDTVRNLTTTLLREAGYEVLSAANGEEAVNAFKAHQDRVRLLLFDVIMPKKNGKEAYEEIRELRPAVKVLFMSGYAGDVFEKKKISELGLDLLAKPIFPSLLLRKVREMLDA